MKSSAGVLLALALPTFAKLNLVQRDSPAVVGLDIKRNEVSDPVTRDRQRWKRDKTVITGLDNEVCGLSWHVRDQRHAHIPPPLTSL